MRARWGRVVDRVRRGAHAKRPGWDGAFRGTAEGTGITVTRTVNVPAITRYRYGKRIGRADEISLVRQNPGETDREDDDIFSIRRFYGTRFETVAFKIQFRLTSAGIRWYYFSLTLFRALFGIYLRY